MYDVKIALPGALATAPKKGTRFYVPNPGLHDVENVPHVESGDWGAAPELEQRLLKAGQVHLTAGGAYLHAAAYITLSGGEV